MRCLRLCFSRLYTRKLSLTVKDHVDDRIQKDPRLVAIGRERNVKLHAVTGEMITNIKDGIGNHRYIEEKDIIARVKKAWTRSGKKVGDIKEMDLYIKPEENAVYYVINGTETGAVEFE